MEGPISVAVVRGGVVEARHRVHAVAVRNGTLVSARGDAALVTFLRSSAKPFQALLLARSRDDLDDSDLAVASASHLGEEQQVAAVRRLLAKAGVSESELECGVQEGRPPERVCHNCSGKHARMLATSAARGWQRAGYRLPEHPVQRENLADIAAAASVHEGDIPTGVDGCGVVTYALPLERMAAMFSRLEGSEGGRTIAAAMRGRPELVGREAAIMAALPGWTVKGGAEGLLCGAAPEGLGVALKAEDGNFRALRPALAAFALSLGYESPELARQPLLNSRGEEVGEIVATES